MGLAVALHSTLPTGCLRRQNALVVVDLIREVIRHLNYKTSASSSIVGLYNVSELVYSCMSSCVSTGHTAISQRGTYSRRCVFVDLKTKKSALSSGPDGLCSIREFPAGAGALWGRKELLKGRASKTEEPRVKSRLCSSKAEL